MPAALRLTRCIFDTLVQMRLDHLLAEGFERLAGGDDLHKDIRAVGVGFYHPLASFNLTFDFSQADDQRSFLQSGPNVFCFHRSKTLSVPNLLKKSVDAI